MAKQFTLGKNERLKSRKAIEQLFKEGKRFSVTPYRIFFIKNEMEGLLAGVGAGTKNFKKAVDRNKIKRLTKEAWRLQKNDLQKKLQLQKKGLHVFFIYTGKEIPKYAQTLAAVKMVLEKLHTIIEN